METDQACEEELTMTPEMRTALEGIHKKIEKEGGETRATVKVIEDRLNAHLIEAAVLRVRVEEHLLDHRAKAKWGWSLAAGVILALCAAGFALATRFIK